MLISSRRQIVTYIADETGYHPTISYEVVGSPFDSSAGGYGGNENKSPREGGYSSPLTDNNLGSGSPINRYSSRIKRQFYAPEDYADIVKIYKSDKNPNLKFRNRRRRQSAYPKKGYLIIYPNTFSRRSGEDEIEKTFVVGSWLIR